MTHKFEFKHTSDESFDIYLNGTHLMEANHDDHGWGGMQDLRTLVERIASNIGAEMSESEASEEE